MRRSPHPRLHFLACTFASAVLAALLLTSCGGIEGPSAPSSTPSSPNLPSNGGNSGGSGNGSNPGGGSGTTDPVTPDPDEQSDWKLSDKLGGVQLNGLKEGVTLPSGVLEIPSEINGKKVTSIGPTAFEKNESITKVIIPSSVTSIGQYAFYYCPNLETVIIKDGVTSIAHYAFANNQQLKTVTLPSTLTYIGVLAFNGCNALEQIVIPDNKNGDDITVEHCAFQYCTNLKKAYFPKNVKKVDAPFTMTTLPDFYYGGSKAEWEAVDFSSFGVTRGSNIPPLKIHYNATPEMKNEPADSSSSDIPSNNIPVDAKTFQYRQELLRLINAERTKAGVAPLTADSSALNDAAQERAVEMQKAGYPTFVRPDGSGWHTVLGKHGIRNYQIAVEDVAAGKVTPSQVFEYWTTSEQYSSSSYKQHILDERYTKLGIGYYAGDYARPYWSQVLLG